MTKFKKAVDLFVESETFEGLSNPATLKAPSDQRQFLENRLHRAFSAGWNAKENADEDKQ